MSLQGKRRKGGGRAGRRQEGVEGGPERRDRAKGEGGEDTKGVGPVSQGIGSPFVPVSDCSNDLLFMHNRVC